MLNSIRRLVSSNRFFKKAFRLIGIDSLWWKYLQPGLYCFNYHRIGSANETSFDPNVFSCTGEQFDEHLKFISKHFKVLTVADVVRIINEGGQVTEKCALITFDDGYIDNYREAFSVLKKHKMTGVFFLPTNFIGSNIIPWWDELAYILRASTVTELQISGWYNAIKIDKKNIETTCRKVSHRIKLDISRTMETKMALIREAANVEVDKISNTDSLFIDWKMANEMLAAGMDIGSHSCSHDILSHLSVEEQYQEVKKSKDVLAAELNQQVTAFAYPVGGKNSYSEQTKSALKKAGYSVAFSSENGVNVNLHDHEYDIHRINVNNNCTIKGLVHLICASNRVE